MTRYRDSFKNNKSKNIDLNNPRDRLLSTKKESDFLSEAESERFVKAYYKYKSRYIPEIDYKDPKTFAFYGSAEKYYEDSINSVYNSYPYDGSKAEKMEWSLSASYLDIYLLEHEYPKEVGSIDFVRTSITNSTGYITVQTPKYIKFFGGPQKNTIYNVSKNRESNIKIDGTTGNTIEFWLKKDAASYLAANKREVILDINSSNTSTSDSNFGRLTVELRSHATKTNLSPFYLTYRSGSTGTALPEASATAYGVRLGTSGKVTCNSVADGKWHHYAITAKTDGSNTIYKFYVDGKLDSTTTENYTIGPVNTFMSGTIGASTKNGAAATMGRGQLSGSLDELRVWKTARSEKEIGRFWYSPVHGGTDNDHTNADLGLYYKFNEGITSTAENDKVVLDYSGRINNGEIINWDASMRSSDSAITLSENVPEKNYQEVGDPIINPDNTRISALRNLLKERGRSHDVSNLSSLRNSVPQYFTDTDTTLFIDLLQIMSSAFDDIFIKIKNLPKIKGYAHQDFFSEKGSYRKGQDNGFLMGCEDIFLEEFTGHHAKPWVSSILEHFGMVSADVFQDATMFERFFNRTEEATFEHDLEEVKRLILSNVHKNLVHILKTKGTESSFRNLIRCFGVDDEIIKLNAYGENEVYELVTKPVYTTVKQKSLSFEGENYQATLFPKAEAGDTVAKGYITGSSAPTPLTMEGNFIFPKYNVDTSVVMDQASLFGLHSIKDDAGSTGTLTFRMDTAAAATGFIDIAMAQDDIYNNETITLEDSSGTTKTFLFDSTNTEGATGTIDGSGNIIIQISGNTYDETSYLTTQIKNAVNGSGLDISATLQDNAYGESEARVLFTQGTPGTAGNTTIVHNTGITSGATIQSFQGGNDGAVADDSSLQVKVIKRRPEAPDAYFELSSTSGIISAISSSYFPNVYDNQHWNIAVRVGTKEGIDFNITSPSQYFIELSGYNYDLDVLQNSFNVSASISASAYNKISQQNRGIFLGAHRTNFSGSVLTPTDVRVLGFNAWQDILTDEELKEHAQNSKVYGRKKPQSISNFDTGGNILSLDSMLWRWQFEAHTSSSSGGEMIIQDMSAAQVGYSESDKYTGKAIGLLNPSTAISQEFLPGVEYFGPDSAYSSDRVKIKNSELEKFKADSRPVTYNFAFEKSMYQVISREMVNFFAGIVGFGNLIGEPVNKYRRKYKLLEKIRNRFFLRVNNEPDIEKFTEYYKWIDSSITKFLSQLIPASSFLSGDIKDVVESHVLERNKYEHKAPTMEFKDPADRTFPILGVNELLYDWEHGHAPNVFKEGVNSKAIKFSLDENAEGGTVEISDSDDFSFTSAGTDTPFSISTWVYVNDIATDDGAIIVRQDPTVNNAGDGEGEWGLSHQTGSLRMSLFAGPGLNGIGTFSVLNGIFFENTSNKMASKTWHFITVTYDGSKNASGLKVYKDATEIPNEAVTQKNNYNGMQNYNLHTTIGGAFRPANTSTFEDLIADTILYNKELTSAEVTEVYNSGKAKDMATFSAYNNIISWWKMGDDFDDVGPAGIRDYKGTNPGTLTGDARIVDSHGLESDIITHTRPWRESRDDSTNCLWVNERAEVSDDRKAIKRITHTEVDGSTYATRRLVKPYRLTADNVVNKKAGFNRDANKNIELYKVINEGMPIVLKKDGLTIQPPCKDIIDPSKKKMISGKTDVTGTDGYFDGDSDLILPFNLVSSSAGTDLPGLMPGLKIANNHQEFEVTGEASLKGPFGETHIGGMPHNKVPFGMNDSHAVSVLQIGNEAALSPGDNMSFKTLDGSTITVTAHSTQTTTDDRDDPTFKIEATAHDTAENLETCLKANSKIISVSRHYHFVTIEMPSGLHGQPVISLLSGSTNPEAVVYMTGTDFKSDRPRPEAYTLSGIESDTLTISSVPVDMPKSMFYRDVSATRFATIRNIKSTTSSLSLGNYVKDYEAVMTTGRSNNNNYFIDNADSFVDSFATVTIFNGTHLEAGNSISFNSDIEGVTIVATAHATTTTTHDTNSPLFKMAGAGEFNSDTAANLARCLNANSRVKAVATGNVVKISMDKSMNGQKVTLTDPAPKAMSATNFTTGYIVEPDLPGLTSFEVPDRGKTEHVIVNRFSAPGSPEASGMFTMDAESAEYSVYNTINYRNLIVRSTLNRLHSERSDQFGLRSGSLTQGSVHKTNRNTIRGPSQPGNGIQGIYSMSGLKFAGEDDPLSNPIGGQQAKTEYVTINNLFNNSGSAGGDNPGLRQGPMSFFTWIKVPPTHTFSEANITYPSSLSNGGAGTGRSTWHSIFSVTSPLSELGQDRTRLGRLRNALFFGVSGYPNLTTNDSATEFVTGSTGRIPSGHLILDASDAEFFHDWVDTGTKIDDDKWHHVGFTYSHDNDSFDIYVDGQLVKQKTYGGTGSNRWMSDSGVLQGVLAAAWYKQINMSSTYFHNFMHATFSNVTTWDDQLSGGEVFELYNNGVPDNPNNHSAAAAPSKLRSWYKLDRVDELEDLSDHAGHSYPDLDAQFGPAIINAGGGNYVDTKSSLSVLNEESEFDSFFIQRPIPSNDLGYSWIAASSNENAHSFLRKNENFPYQHTFSPVSGTLRSEQSINFVEASELQPDLGFYNNNSHAPNTLDTVNSIVSYANAPLNSQVLNIQGPYGWPTWKQIRGYEHPISRYERLNSKLSIVVGQRANVITPFPPTLQQYEWSTNPRLANLPERSMPIGQLLEKKIEVYNEVPATNKFNPITITFHGANAQELNADAISQAQSEAYWTSDETSLAALGRSSLIRGVFRTNLGGRLASLKVTVGNEETKFSNYRLMDRLSIEDVRVPLAAQKILEELGSEPLHEEVFTTEINYIETLYPREVNTFTKESRIRETFDFFAWRDLRADRALILTGSVVNNVGSDTHLGLLPPQEGSAFRFDGSSGYVEVLDNDVLTPVGVKLTDMATRDFSGANSRATASDSSLLTMGSAEPYDIAVQEFDAASEYFQIAGGATSPLHFSQKLSYNLGVKRFQGGSTYESVAVTDNDLTFLTTYTYPVNELRFNGSSSKIVLDTNTDLSFAILASNTTDNGHVEFGHVGSGVDQKFEVPDEKLHSFVEPFGTETVQTARRFTGNTGTNRNYLHATSPTTTGKEYIYSMVKQSDTTTECDYSIMFWIKPDDITSYGLDRGYERRTIVQKRNGTAGSHSQNYEWMVAQHNRKIYLYTRCGVTGSPLYYKMVDDILDDAAGASAPWQCILITYNHLVGDRKRATQQVRIKDDGYAIDDLVFRVRCNLHSTDHIKVQFDSTKYENESTYDSSNRVLNIGVQSYNTGDSGVSDDIAEIVRDKMNSIVTSSHKEFDVTRSTNYLTFTMHAIGPVDSPDPNSGNNPIIFTTFTDTYRSSDIEILTLSDGSHPQVKYYKNGIHHETVSAPTIVPENTGQDHSYKYQRMVATAGNGGESLMVGRNSSTNSDSWTGWLAHLLLFKHDGVSFTPTGKPTVKHNTTCLSSFDAGRLYNDGFIFDYESNIRHMDIVGWWHLDSVLASSVTNGNDGGTLYDGGGSNSVTASTLTGAQGLFLKEKHLKSFVISFWCKPVTVTMDNSNRIIISRKHEWMVYKKNKRLYLRLYDSKHLNTQRNAHYFVDFESDELLTADEWQHVSIEVYIPYQLTTDIHVTFLRNNNTGTQSTSWIRPSTGHSNQATPSEDGSGNVLGLPSLRPMNTGNKLYIGQSQNNEMETTTGGTSTKAATAGFHGGLREVAIWAANENPSPHGFVPAATPTPWTASEKAALYGLPGPTNSWAAPYDLRRHPLAEDLMSWWTMRGPQNGSYVGTVIDQVRGRNAVPQSNINLVQAGTAGNLSPKKYEDVSFSIAVWVKPTDLSAVSSIVAKLNTDASANGQEWDLTLQTNGKVRLHVADHFPRTNRGALGFRGHFLDSTAALTQDEYTHVVAIYRASTQDFKYYINGAVSGTGKTTYESSNATLSPNEYVSMAPSSTPVTIGCRTATSTTDQHFEGSLHRMAIYRDKELNDSEVAELYNSGNAWEIKQASTYSDMLSYFKLDSASPSDVKSNTTVASSANLNTFQPNNSSASDVLNNSYNVDKSFTIAFYYRKESTTQNGRILGKWGTSASSQEYKIEQDGRALKLYLADTTGTDNQSVVTMFDAPHVLSDSTSEWEHIVVTYNADTRKAAFYVDGSTLNSAGGFGSYEGDYFEMQTSGVAFRLGDTYNTPASAVDSGTFKISNLVMFAGEFFSQAYVTELYNSGRIFDYNTHSVGNKIVLWWALDDATGTNVNDSSGLGHHGTANTSLDLNTLSGLMKDTYEDKPFTISFWARQSAATSDRAIISKADIFGNMTMHTDVGEWAVTQGPSGNLIFSTLDPKGPNAQVQKKQYIWNSILSTAAWKFITIVYDPTATDKAVLYHGTHTTNSLDGSAAVPTIIGGTDYSSMRPSEFVTRIGNTPSSSASNGGVSTAGFPGKLSNMIVYDVALNTAQVTDIYNTGYPRDLRSLSTFSDAVAYWKLDEPSLAAIDQTSNSLDGLRAGPTQLAATSSGLDKKEMADLPFSFGIWVRKKNFTDDDHLMSKYGTGVAEYLTTITSAGHVKLSLIGEDLLGAQASNTFEVQDVFDTTNDIDKWVHLCITYDPITTTMKVYKDGALEGSSTGFADPAYKRMLDTNGLFAIGAVNGNTTSKTDALLSHAVIFRDCELNLTEVQELYNNNYTWDYNTHSQVSKIVAWWKLNEQTTTAPVTFADSSSNSHTLTASGNAVTGASAADAAGEKLENFEYKTRAMTISLWVRPERLTGEQVLFTRYGDPGENIVENSYVPASDKEFSLLLIGQKLTFDFYDKDTPITTTRRFETDDVITEVNKWYHVALTYKPNTTQTDGGDVVFYVDGVTHADSDGHQIGSGDSQFSHPITNAAIPLRFGGNPGNFAYAGQWLQGSLANILYYIHAVGDDVEPLSSGDINVIKNLGLLFCGAGTTALPRFTEAVGYWRMNENDSSFGRVKNNSIGAPDTIFGSSFGGITQEATEAEEKFGYFYKTTQADKFNYTKSNGFGIDIVDVDSGQTTTADPIFITSSRWPLDARSNFEALPLDLLTSSFNSSADGEACFSYQATSHGTRGEGILQNDYSIFSCGANFQHGTPPVAPVYSRRTPQEYIDHYIGTVTITDNSKLASGDKISFTTLDGTTITAEAHSSTTTSNDTNSPTFAISQLATLSEQNEQTAIRLKNCLNANSKITATMSNSIANTVEIKITTSGLALSNKTITLTDAGDTGMTKADFTAVSTNLYLAGEAEWKVGSQLGVNPFDTDFEAHAENFRQIGQDHSLVPEFIISDHVEDVTLNANGDFTDLVNRDSFLSVTGAVYNASSGELSINSRFYKTYGISDMMKYFGVTLEEIEDNELGDPLKITLRCKAAIKFTPYRGFYPVERVQQITEMFSRGYMSEFEFESVPDTAIPPFIKDQETLLKTKVRANMQQSIKPLFAPGVLMNSIKSGMAVDYPLFTAENSSIQITSGSNNEGYKTLVISDRDGVTVPAASKAANGDYFAAANIQQPNVNKGRVHLYKKSLTPSTGVEEFTSVHTLESPVDEAHDNEQFGISTSLDGNFLAVGNTSGRAKLTQNTGTTYQLDINTRGLMANGTGSIYVYQKSGDNFNQLISTIKDPDDARLKCSVWDNFDSTDAETNCTVAVGDVIENEGFGRRVLIKNPYIFTSARIVKRAEDGSDSTTANCIYVYKAGYQGSFNNQPDVDGFESIDGTRDLFQRVVPSTADTEILERFACDNALSSSLARQTSRLFDYSNNILVASAPAKDPRTGTAGQALATVDGHVFVFSIDAATGRFAERQTITPPSGYVQARGTDFGRAVSLSSDASTLAIGQPQFTVSTNTGTRAFNGVVHIYEYGADNNYSYKQTLSMPSPSNASTGDLFGSSIDIDGSYMVVSAQRANDNREFVFKKGADGTWIFAVELLQDLSTAARGSDGSRTLFTGGDSIIHGGKIFAGTRQFPEESTKELMFISDIIEDTVDNYDTIKRQVISPSKQFNKAVENINNFTGSLVNNTRDSGVPRLKGNAYKRITFEEMLNPDFLEGIIMEDQEPHPSASIYYADKYTGKVMDFPFKFGQFDITNNEIDLGVSEFSLKKSLSESLKPYRLAVNNFCAETINFFLEDGRTATLETQENVFPLLEKNEDYKMRVEIVNSNTRMYDRHSAFGPPVDEGEVKLLSNKEVVAFKDQHAYSPFVPPFLDPGSSPYVDITFTPTETRNYTLSEIIDGAQYDYRNFSTIPENSSTNSNYLNAMSLEASLKLDSFVVYQPTTSDAGSTIEQRSRWVIQPRWETPVLNFIESEGSALNLNDNKLDTAVSGRVLPWQKRNWENFYVSKPADSAIPYLTSSIGMWHQAGKLPKSDKEGYTIRIAPHPDVTKARNQLADAVGFTNKNALSAQVGRLRKKKVIYEAVVAIPFIEPENSNQNIRYFELDDTYYDTALNLNRKIQDTFERSLLNLERTSAEYETAVEEYERIYNTPGQRPEEAIAYQLRMQDKYVIPQEFRKKMMYVFQFSAEFTRNDLANIWQNVSPTSDFSGKDLRYSTVDNSQGISGESQDIQYISNFLNELSPTSRAMDFKNKKIRWIVLKVKQKAEIDLNRVKRNSLEGPRSLDRLVVDNTRGSFSGTPELRRQRYSFNWPYDFFSIVELVKLEGKVDIFDTVPTTTDSEPIGE